LIDEDVVCFHISMENAERVEIFETVEDLESEEFDDILLELFRA